MRTKSNITYLDYSQALCAQTDPEVFFPYKGGSVRDAKRICAECPVRMDCLREALAKNYTSGIWGGLSERERRALKGKALPEEVQLVFGSRGSSKRKARKIT